MSAAAKSIVWIASYPKSGNTWVRFMACNLLFGRQESASALGRFAPDIHEIADSAPMVPPSGLLKTHFVFSPSLPHAERTAAAIYVVRDPADVLTSNFFYARRSAPNVDDTTSAFNQYVDKFIEHRGDPRWIQAGMGTWDQNVIGWLQTPHEFPVVRIRYEDLSAAPTDACRAIARLLRPESTEEDLERAVLNSSFQRMREIERADIRERRVGIFYKPYLQASIDSGSRFMRRGVVGDGSGRLNGDQRARLRDRFAPLLAELGYRSGGL